MTLATLVTDYEKPGWAISNPGPDTTITPTVAVGDLYIVIAGGDEWGGATDNISTPSGGGLTYNVGPKGVPTVGGQNSEVFSWYGIAGSAQTNFTLTMQTAGASPHWGFDFIRFSGSDGIGATSQNVSAGTNTAISLSLTTTFANSGILAFFADWNAPSLTGRTWLAINGYTPATNIANGEVVAFQETNATYLCCYYPDVGPAGAKTTGLSAPATGRWSGLALEVRGSSGGSPAFDASRFMPFFR